MKYIIYPNPERPGVCLITPTGILSVEETARKDVPAGLPYLIVEDIELPDGGRAEFFEAWDADFSNPDGYGIGPEAWFAEQEAQK